MYRHLSYYAYGIWHVYLRRHKGQPDLDRARDQQQRRVHAEEHEPVCREHDRLERGYETV